MCLERALHDLELDVRMSGEEAGQPEQFEILGGQGTGLIGLRDAMGVEA